jgi:hypothetical protein
MTMAKTDSKPPDARLEPLLGAWEVQGAHPADPSVPIRGRTTFEWLVGEQFVVERWTFDHPDFPDGVAILGEGEAGFAQHYFDSRGVARVYALTVTDEVWELAREHPGFSQRFVGAFADGGRRIDGRWEKRLDDVDWELDFHLTYTRAA